MDPTANGFQNLDTTLKYRVFKSPKHEFVLSAGLSVEWGGTGSATVGAEAFNTYIPTLYFGKGLIGVCWRKSCVTTETHGSMVPG
jgi:hypothetical protein